MHCNVKVPHRKPEHDRGAPLVSDTQCERDRVEQRRNPKPDLGENRAREPQRRRPQPTVPPPARSTRQSCHSTSPVTA